MADYTDLDPTLLRASVSDGTNLKPSITTSSYGGGTPSAAADLKRSIAYADGTLKPSIADSIGVKASWLLAGSARPPGGAAATYPVAILAHQETSGTAGQTLTVGARRTRTINTEVSDEDSIVTLSSNQFTLQAGDYWIYGWAATNSTDQVQTYLYNVTDAADEAIINGYTRLSPTENDAEPFIAHISIAGVKAFEIQQQTDENGNGGLACSFGDVEQYLMIEIHKVA